MAFDLTTQLPDYINYPFGDNIFIRFLSHFPGYCHIYIWMKPQVYINPN